MRGVICFPHFHISVNEYAKGPWTLFSIVLKGRVLKAGAAAGNILKIEGKAWQLCLAEKIQIIARQLFVFFWTVSAIIYIFFANGNL